MTRLIMTGAGILFGLSMGVAAPSQEGTVGGGSKSGALATGEVRKPRGDEWKRWDPSKRKPRGDGWKTWDPSKRKPRGDAWKTWNPAKHKSHGAVSSGTRNGHPVGAVANKWEKKKKASEPNP